MSSELVLPGLDGSNPLAFLAALGTLRALTRAWPDCNVKIAWNSTNGAWRPVLDISPRELHDVVAALLVQCRTTKEHKTLGMADNLNINAEDFRRHLHELIDTDDRDATSYAVSFGCDAIRDDVGNIVDTSLRTMSGAGHQHFLKTMREILSVVTTAQLQKALFEPWQYDDPLRGLSLRLDPSDDKRYALGWADPSGDPMRSKRGNMVGANALAVLGMPLLAVAPVRGTVQTRGFTGRHSNDCYWTWPIWECFLSLEVVSSALAMTELQYPEVPRRRLMQLGITEAFRSQRITVGKFRNFTPAVPV